MNCYRETTSIRLLADADLERADLILKSAFRRVESRIRELRLYRKIQPCGWFLALQDGKAAGMVGGTSYTAFAYVGMMAVHQRFQRQGIGLALMRHLLAWLDSQGVPLVLLDASDQGQSLYERFGFRSFNHTYVMRRSGVLPVCQLAPHVKIVTTQNLDDLAEWDGDIFGGDRSRVLYALLDTLPGRAFLSRDEHGKVAGYLFAQERCIGPWAAAKPQDAEVLLQAALSLPYEGDVSVVIPEANLCGIDMLTSYGFRIVRANRHMGRGKDRTPIERSNIYGQTSLALG